MSTKRAKIEPPPQSHSGLNGFNLFNREYVAKLKKRHTASKSSQPFSITQATRESGAKWSTLSKEEKAEYDEKQAKDQINFLWQLAQWRERTGVEYYEHVAKKDRKKQKIEKVEKPHEEEPEQHEEEEPEQHEEEEEEAKPKSKSSDKKEKPAKPSTKPSTTTSTSKPATKAKK